MDRCWTAGIFVQFCNLKPRGRRRFGSWRPTVLDLENLWPTYKKVIDLLLANSASAPLLIYFFYYKICK